LALLPLLREQGFFYPGVTMSETNTNKNQRVVTFLNRDEVDFLDKLGKDALFSTGTKLSRAKLIAWLVDFLKGLGIDGDNIASEEDLEQRVLEVLKQIASQEGSAPTRHGRSTIGKEAAQANKGGTA
jgi:hypothetical protein